MNKTQQEKRNIKKLENRGNADRARLLGLTTIGQRLEFKKIMIERGTK